MKRKLHPSPVKPISVDEYFFLSGNPLCEGSLGGELTYCPRPIDCEEPPPYVSGDYVDGYMKGCEEQRELDGQEMRENLLLGFVAGGLLACAVALVAYLWK